MPSSGTIPTRGAVEAPHLASELLQMDSDSMIEVMQDDASASLAEILQEVDSGAIPQIRKRRQLSPHTGSMRALRSTGQRRQVRISSTSEQRQVRLSTAERAQLRSPTDEHVRTRISTGEQIRVRPTGEHPSFEAGASGLMTLKPQNDDDGVMMGGAALLGRTAMLSQARAERLEDLRRTRELQKAHAMVQIALQQAESKGDKEAQQREQKKLSYLEFRQRKRTQNARQQALISLGVVMGLSWGAVALGGLGQGEMALDPGEPMIYLRAGLLLAAALGVTLGMRREKLTELGLKPKWIPAALAVPIIAVIAVAASMMARFEVAAEASLPVLLGLVGLRALASATFFQGVVNRLLTRSFTEPAGALMITALSYALYGTTYAALLQGDAFHTFYAGMLYFVGLGLPMSLIYQQTRSVLVVAAGEFIILGACAWSGLQFAQGL